MGTNYFKELAAKANNTTNSEESKSIRKKLIIIGTILSVIGYIGVISCFISFILIGVQTVNNFGKSSTNSGQNYHYPNFEVDNSSEIIDYFNSLPTDQNEDEFFPTRILIPFFLFPIFGIVAGIGTSILKLGLGIVVTGYASKFVDTNHYCPNCGDLIDEDEKFCNKCGQRLQIDKVCRDCGHENDYTSVYCSNCGSKLF